MITTVTTVTSITSVAAMGFTSVVSVAAVVVLILLLGTKELTGASGSLFCRLSSRFLNVGIIPLVMAFTVIVVARIFEILA